MLRTRSVISALLLLALSALPTAAAPPSTPDAAKAEHQRVVKFWTAERMASAIPRDFVRAPDGLQPAAKPNNNGKGNGKGKPGGSGDTVSGASWTKGGKVKTAVGKVFFRLSGTLYTCSGSVAKDNRSGYSLVLTAAHCAFDERNGSFATEWMFIPDYESSPTRTCSNTRFGCWMATALVVHSGYATAGSFNTQATVHDFAFAVVGTGGHSASAQLDATVGTFDITFSSFASGTRMYAFGYPAAGKYKGATLTYCAGPIFFDAWNSNLTYGMECDMTGGSSGGPWLSSFNESSGSGTLSSLNSYGYSGVKNMYGPKFNNNTKAVYDKANHTSTTSDTIVP
jgi:hypothetical protein